MIAAAFSLLFRASPEFANLPHNEMPNYILEKNTPTSEIIAEAAETIEELGHQKYYPPTIIGFIYLLNGPAATNLWLLVPCTSLSNWRGLTWSHFPAIWHDNRWKFGFGFSEEE